MPRCSASYSNARQNASSSETEVRCPSIVTDRFSGGVIGGKSIIALVGIMRPPGPIVLCAARLTVMPRLSEFGGIGIALGSLLVADLLFADLAQVDRLAHAAPSVPCMICQLTPKRSATHVKRGEKG